MNCEVPERNVALSQKGVEIWLGAFERVDELLPGKSQGVRSWRRLDSSGVVSVAKGEGWFKKNQASDSCQRDRREGGKWLNMISTFSSKAVSGAACWQ